MKRWLGTLFLPNNLRLGAVAGSYLGEKFGDLLQGGGHFGKMPVRCTAKTVLSLSLLSRVCGGPLRLKRMVAARDVEGIVACLQQVAHNRPLSNDFNLLSIDFNLPSTDFNLLLIDCIIQ